MKPLASLCPPLRTFLPFLILPLALAAATGLDFPAQYDESHHLAFAEYISRHPTLHTLASYEGAQNYEAKGPLFFILASFWGSAFGFSLPTLRILVLLFSLAAVAFAAATAQLLDVNGRPRMGGGIALLPYFAIMSVTFMSDVPSLCFLLLSLLGYLVYLSSGSKSHLVLAAISATCVSYIRVDGLFFLAGVFAAAAIRKTLDRKLVIALAAPALLRLPLVILWGGLAAPPAQTRPIPVEVGFDVSHLVFCVQIVGLYFAPALLERQAHRFRRHGFAAFATAISMSMVPRFIAGDQDHYGGFLSALALRIQGPEWLASLALAALLYVGILVLAILFFDGGDGDTAQLAIRLACAAGLVTQVVRGAVFYERYLLQVTPLFVLALFSTRSNRSAAAAWTIYCTIILLAQIVEGSYL